MKWESSVTGGLRPAGAAAGAAGSFCMVLDFAIGYAAAAGGASLTAAQAVGFSLAAMLRFWLTVRARPQALAGRGGWALVCAAALVACLVFSLRSAMLELFVQSWDLPPSLGLLFAVVVSGLIIKNGYRLCLSAAARPGNEIQWQPLVIGVVGYACLLRLVYGAEVELLPEETYYWNYSRHLDIGYLDHPPLVAWLIRAGTGIFGNHELGVRVGALFSCAIASAYLFRLTRNVFGEPSAWLALMMVQVLPFFFMSGFLMTPDAPLTAAWAAALFYLERALLGDRPKAWFAVGVALGLGMLAKYTIALLGLGALVFMILDPASRRWFRRWEPYAAALIAAAVFTPVIVWNAEHEWASFAFQTSRRLAEAPRFSLHKLIGAAMVLLTPTGLVAVGAAFVRGMPGRVGLDAGEPLRRRWRLLTVCTAVPLVVFTCFSLRHEVKLDWTGAPWVAAVPILAISMVARYTDRASTSWPWAKGAWPPTVICMLFLYAAGLYHLVLGLPGVGYSRHMELVPVAWRELGREVQTVADDVRSKQDGGLLIVGMDRYAIASELAFYSDDQARSVAETSSSHVFGDMGLMYEQWFPLDAQAGRTLLLIAWAPEALAAPLLEPHVSRLDPVREFALQQRGRPVRSFYYRVAYDYRPTGTTGRTGQ